MNRRNFIVKSSFLFAGITLPISTRASDNIETILYKEQIWPILWKFAKDIGVGVATTIVADYIKDYLYPDKDEKLITSINQTNSHLNQEGYDDYSESSVYSSSKSYRSEPNLYKEEAVDDTIFYGIKNKETEEIVIPFFDRKTQKQIGTFYAPDMIGLGSLSDMLSKRYSQDYIRDSLYPLSFIQEAKGSIRDGYSQVTMFKTKKGSISINYTVSNVNSIGKGKVFINAMINGYAETFSIPVEFNL